MTLPLYDRVKCFTATIGQGPITVGAALSGYRTPAAAGIPNGTSLPLLVIMGGGDWEISTGVYTVSTNSFTRVLRASSTGALLNLDGTGIVTVTLAAQEASSFLTAADLTAGLSQAYAFRNRVINGDFRIDQRHGGVAFTGNGGYACDRWSFTAIGTTNLVTIGRNLNNIAPPPGFMTYMGAQVGVVHAVVASDVIAFNHVIEGINIADLGWPQAAPQPVTLSFWAYSSLTGNFGATLKHGAGTYCWPFLFNIPVANTWTKITVTVPGPTAGPAWPTDIQAGMYISVCLGAGANWTQPPNVWTVNNCVGANGQVQMLGTLNAVLYLTGVQMEFGAVATPFERRFYDLEFGLCQRYFQRWDYSNGNAGQGMALSAYHMTGQPGIYANIPLYKPMRGVPSITSTSSTARYVTDANISSHPFTGLVAQIGGPILLTMSGQPAGTAPGWLDSMGVITADADY